jgi:hypothetical protein
MHNVSNANPTYLGYCHTMNSVILGQASVSRKSNTGGAAGACAKVCRIGICTIMHCPLLTEDVLNNITIYSIGYDTSI